MDYIEPIEEPSPYFPQCQGGGYFGDGLHMLMIYAMKEYGVDMPNHTDHHFKKWLEEDGAGTSPTLYEAQINVIIELWKSK